MQEIQAWFKNGNYSEGVALYERYGQNSFLKDLFSTGPSDYNIKKLNEELLSINSENSASNSDYSETFLDTIALNSENSNNSENSDRKPNPKAQEHYLNLCKRRDQIIKQLERNMSLLDISQSKNVRFETARQILSLHNQKTKIWEQLDYFDEHDSFPDPVSVKPAKTDELQRLYVQISKAEKRLKSDNVKNPEKTRKLLEEKRAQLEAIKQERGML